MESIGEKIYNLRTERDLSQEELADQLNVARQTVSRWETNVVSPTKENLENLCRFFNLKENYFSDKENAIEEPIGESCAVSEICTMEEESSIEKPTEESCAVQELCVMKEISTVESPSIEQVIEIKKSERFKTLKILLVAACMTLLGLLSVALGIAAYVAISPIGGQYVDTVDVINYEGIVFVVLGAVAISVFITSAVLIIKKAVKKQKKGNATLRNQNVT